VSVLVDTPIWSLALRRKTRDLSSHDQRIILTLQKLAQQGEVQLLGMVRQEMLSGVRDERRFLIIRDRLRAFPDVSARASGFPRGSQLKYPVPSGRLTSSTVDIYDRRCCLRNGWQIFSTDADFFHFAKVVPIQLFVLPREPRRLQ
jgi:hypothetical protein